MPEYAIYMFILLITTLQVIQINYKQHDCQLRRNGRNVHAASPIV